MRMPQQECYKFDTKDTYPELPGHLRIVLIDERDRNKRRRGAHGCGHP